MVVSLSSRLNGLDFPTQLEAVRDVLDAAQAKISFWGTRVIKVAGNRGSVSLEAIVKRVLSAADKYSELDDLLPDERIAGVDIVRKLQEFYQATDAEIRQSSCFIAPHSQVEGRGGISYRRRLRIEEAAEKEFRCYSKERFTEVFGGSSDDSTGFRSSDGFLAFPFRVAAKEDLIRARMVRTKVPEGEQLRLSLDLSN